VIGVKVVPVIVEALIWILGVVVDWIVAVAVFVEPC
jgi:hypothetical protein